MAKRDSTLVVPDGASIGKIELVADLGTGLCEIILWLPFSLEPVRCNVPLVDILEASAGITIAMCQMRRGIAPVQRT